MSKFYPGQRVYVKFWNEKRFGIIINAEKDLVEVQFDDTGHPTFFLPKEFEHLNTVDKNLTDVTFYKQNYVTAVDQCSFISLNPEYCPNEGVIEHTGRFYTYCVHNKHGSCSFMLELDHQNNWRCNNNPAFICNDIIRSIGQAIEQHYQEF